MKSAVNKNWWLVLLKGVILIVLAFIVFGNPVETLLSISIFLGLGFLLSGIVITFLAFAAKNEMDNWGWKLAEGLLDILFGFILIANPEVTAVIFPFLIGFWATFYGILLIVGAFYTVKFSWTLMISGILTVILGYIVLFNPIVSVITISIWIGITLLVLGISNIVFAFEIKNIQKEVNELE